MSGTSFQVGWVVLVQRVVMPSSVESWTVIGDDHVPVAPVERFLAHLSSVDRSVNTVKAYAHDLKDFWEFLRVRGLDWREVQLEDLGDFIGWLRLPRPERDGRVGVGVAASPVAAVTINRKLSALSAFYVHQVRHGVDVGDLLTTWQAGGGRGGWKPFLHHVAGGKAVPGRLVGLRVVRRLPRVLTVGEVQSILDACDHLRDRFLFALLYDSGIRIGEALGLRHEDVAAAEREIRVVARGNANGARSKSAATRQIPVSDELIRLWADYLNGEYGDLDSDYVFVNLFAQPRGRAMSYPAVHDLVVRLRSRTGVDFDPHWFRHTMATRLLRDEVPVEVVSGLLGHASIHTTLSVYGHLTAADARAALERAGWFTGAQVTW